MKKKKKNQKKEFLPGFFNLIKKRLKRIGINLDECIEIIKFDKNIIDGSFGAFYLIVIDRTFDRTAGSEEMKEIEKLLSINNLFFDASYIYLSKKSIVMLKEY